MLDWKGSGIIELLSWYFPAGNEKTHEKPVRIAGVPVEIRTKLLPNVSLQRYLYTNLSNKNNNTVFWQSISRDAKCRLPQSKNVECNLGSRTPDFVNSSVR